MAVWRGETRLSRCMRTRSINYMQRKKQSQSTGKPRGTQSTSPSLSVFTARWSNIHHRSTWRGHAKPACSPLASPSWR